ncbi:glycosyltransferase [Candidatus Bathyarchaeota archaeon]|nr:glycosyltransferase [Candidatus Bathyarchaeota archaeon]
MPTKNSARTLKRCLSAVYREIPICHLIVIDANSTDGTVEILRQYPNVILVRGPWNLGKAREIGIKRVHTDFFMFVDSDVEIAANCMREMLASMRSSDVGAVEGTGCGRGYMIPFLLLLKIVYSFIFGHMYSREKALKAAMHQSLVHIYYTCGVLKARFAQPRLSSRDP